VLKTFETGEPESGIPATLTLEGEHASVALRITAIKAGEIVMLRIEGLGD
jgi:hypothetical protein